MIELEENITGITTGPGAQPEGWFDEANVEWIIVSESTNPITAFNIIPSPWEETEDLIMAGDRL